MRNNNRGNSPAPPRTSVLTLLFNNWGLAAFSRKICNTPSGLCRLGSRHQASGHPAAHGRASGREALYRPRPGGPRPLLPCSLSFPRNHARPNQTNERLCTFNTWNPRLAQASSFTPLLCWGRPAPRFRLVSTPPVRAEGGDPLSLERRCSAHSLTGIMSLPRTGRVFSPSTTGRAAFCDV